MPTATMLQTSGAYEYYTPAPIIEAARETMGGIDLDPASSEVANRTVRATRYYTKEQDGLKQEWSGRVWMNHPFGRESNPRWISKLHSSWGADGTGLLGVTCACCITYACTSEAWFKMLLYYPQCYLTPRTNYLLPDGTVYRGVQKGSVVTFFPSLTAFDDEPGSVERFRRAFKALGVVKV